MQYGWIIATLATLIITNHTLVDTDNMNRKPNLYEEMATKSNVALVNVVTSPVEIPAGIYTRSKEQSPLTGFTVGTVEGVGNGINRCATGLFDFALFLFPMPREDRADWFGPSSRTIKTDYPLGSAFSGKQYAAFPEEKPSQTIIEKIGRKLGTGLGNILGAVPEVPGAIVNRARKKDIISALIVGPIEGVSDGGQRLAAGVWDTLTFFIPMPPKQGLAPTLKPLSLDGWREFADSMKSGNDLIYDDIE